VKETIFVGKDKHEIDVERITLIVKGGEVDDIDTPSRIMIEPTDTLTHAGRLGHELAPHPETERLVGIVFPKGPVASRGYLHTLGLIDLSLRYRDQGKAFGWRYPETYLYPKEQCQLADVLIELTKESS
jgi:hypothetical protein